MGASADEAIIDKYVAQHYNSFTRAERQQGASTNTASPSTAATSASTTAAPSSDITMTLADQRQQVSPFKGDGSFDGATRSSASPAGDINPHLVELSSVHQPFTVSRLSSFGQAAASPNKSNSSYRSNSAEADGMSEDDEEEVEEEGEEDVKPKTGKFTAFRPSRIDKPSHEEAPIPGSIMGPSNELRPDPEEYRKLSSKEKRQLRNKISARNFRTRRKEHISHLEQQVADRDALIEGLRQQLSQVTVQNKELNEEVRALKSKSMSSSDVNKILEALQKGLLNNNNSSSSSATLVQDGPMGPPPRSSSSASMNEPVSRSSRPSTPNMIPSSPRPMSPRPSMVRRQSPAISQPNTKKDLPPSASSSSGPRSFWGGVGGSGSSSNFMSVHTVLVPHLPASSLTLGEKSGFGFPRQSDETAQLARLLSEKLNVADHSSPSRDDGSEKSPSSNSKALTDAQVNEAFVSLMSEGDEAAPPSYTEATTTAVSGSSKEEDHVMHTAIVEALSKAFASSSSSKTVDQNKLQALLDGRASLCLIDNDSGKPL